MCGSCATEKPRRFLNEAFCYVVPAWSCGIAITAPGIPSRRSTKGASRTKPWVVCPNLAPTHLPSKIFRQQHQRLYQLDLPSPRLPVAYELHVRQREPPHGSDFTRNAHVS